MLTYQLEALNFDPILGLYQAFGELIEQGFPGELSRLVQIMPSTAWRPSSVEEVLSHKAAAQCPNYEEVCGFSLWIGARSEPIYFALIRKGHKYTFESICRTLSSASNPELFEHRHVIACKALGLAVEQSGLEVRVSDGFGYWDDPETNLLAIGKQCLQTVVLAHENGDSISGAIVSFLYCSNDKKPL